MWMEVWCMLWAFRSLNLKWVSFLTLPMQNLVQLNHNIRLLELSLQDSLQTGWATTTVPTPRACHSWFNEKSLVTVATHTRTPVISLTPLDPTYCKNFTKSLCRIKMFWTSAQLYCQHSPLPQLEQNIHPTRNEAAPSVSFLNPKVCEEEIKVQSNEPVIYSKFESDGNHQVVTVKVCV